VAAGSTAAVNRRAEQSPWWGRSAPEAGIAADYRRRSRMGSRRMQRRRLGVPVRRKLGLRERAGACDNQVCRIGRRGRRRKIRDRLPHVLRGLVRRSIRRHY